MIRQRIAHTLAVLPLAGLSLAVAMMFAAPAGAASPPGVLVVARSLDDIVSLDPAEGFELSSVQAFTSLYQRLVEPDPDHPERPQPVLAESWQPGPVPHSLVFTLRAGAVFANGDAVRPEDVIYSLSRAVHMDRSPAFILGELGWTPATIDASLQRLDARHVRIDWSANVGDSFALAILGAPVASILDARELAAHEVQRDAGNAWLQGHSAGSGPFKLRRYIPHEALVLDANPSSPTDAPRLRTVVLRSVADAATRRLLVQVGDADIAQDLDPDQVEALHGVAGLRTLQFPSATIDYLLFNTTRSGVLANPALWEAARWLIDYDGIAGKLLRGQFEVHQAFLADGFPGALNSTPYRLDIGRARAILRAAGLDHGVTITLEGFNQPPYTEIAQSLQSTFAAAGIRLDLLPELASELYTRMRARAEQAVWLYWIPDYYDAHSTASAFAANREDGTNSIAWRAGWHIPALTAATQAAVEQPDPAARLAAYRSLQEQVQRSSPLIIALQARSQVVLRANVHGYRQGLDADMVYYDRVTK